VTVNLMEAVQVSPLKGDQNAAQGFSPGLGNSRECALKGQQNPARHIGSKSFARVSSFSRHFQRAFLQRSAFAVSLTSHLSPFAVAWWLPRVETWLKPWAELFCPLEAKALQRTPLAKV
jgi:hypothetical protein